ncbi:MAG: lecithin retinol acyltransferase family protein [Sulfurifustis sp.]
MNQVIPSSQSVIYVPVGTVVSVPVFGIYRHKAIVTDQYVDRKPLVIACSAKSGQVKEETWDAFAEGKDVTVEGHLGKLHPLAVLNRARTCLGKSYNVFFWNCEHFVFYAHGLEPHSPQLALSGVIALLCFGVVAMAGR